MSGNYLLALWRKHKENAIAFAIAIPTTLLVLWAFFYG